MKSFLADFLGDLKVELMDEFDRNFEHKSFFNEPWPREKFPNRRGSLLMRSGALRRSLRATNNSNSVQFFSSLPYAAIHNEGGTIVVTQKMKRFFWAMYYKTSGAISKTKKGDARQTQRNRSLNMESQYWKALALKKAGSKLTIEKRQFIGAHKQVDISVERVLDKSMQKISESFYNKLKT